MPIGLIFSKGTSRIGTAAACLSVHHDLTLQSGPFSQIESPTSPTPCDGTAPAVLPALDFPMAPKETAGSNQPLKGGAVSPWQPGRGEPSPGGEQEGTRATGTGGSEGSG